jgi:putative ABC transport system permease protein
MDQVSNRLLASGLASVVLILSLTLLGWTRLLPVFLLLPGPLIYLYVLRQHSTDFILHRRQLLHFISILPGIIFITFSETIPFLRDIVIKSLPYISVIGYLYGSYRKLQKSTPPVRFALRWLNRMLAVSCGLTLLLMPYQFIAYMHDSYPLTLLVAILLISVAVRGFLMPGDSKAEAPELNLPAEFRHRAVSLKKLMDTRGLYRDSELSLASLAETMGMHPNELSRLINSVFRKNFSDFINEFRIREVTRKMKDPNFDQLTLLGIAMDAGFNSKTTFNRVFRQFTGKTPAEYKADLKRERPLTQQELVPGTSSVWPSLFMYNLKMAWRHLVKSKGYTALNVLGLATGMGAALLIGLWIFEQYSYDRYLPGYKQVYQVQMNLKSQYEGEQTQSTIALPLVDVLRKEIPGIEYAVATDHIGHENHNLSTGDKKFYLAGGSSDPDFFKIFPYTFIKGSATEALKDSFSIVLTETTARSLFGDSGAMGKYLLYDHSRRLQVTGIIKDIPATSTLQFKYITPFALKEQTEGWIQRARTRWNQNSFSAYIRLKAGVDLKDVAPAIKNIVYQRSADMKPLAPSLLLQPQKDWHLVTEFRNGKPAGGFVDYIHLFGIIGILILLIACINFVNLSTARSARRAKEIGIRKAVGSMRKDLAGQFLLESVLISFIAFIFCLYFVQMALPSFNTLTGSSISIPYSESFFWILVIPFVLCTGFVAGSGSAFYLSSFPAVRALRGLLSFSKKGAIPRKIMVVLQFSCSVALIIATIVVYREIEYVKKRPLGYSPGRLTVTDMNGALGARFAELKKDLLSTGVVEAVTASTTPVTLVNSHLVVQNWPGKRNEEQEFNVGEIGVSADYFKTLKMEFAAGHNFSSDWQADSLNVIVNEALLKRGGLIDPVNKIISWNGNSRPVRIIGVVKDALMESPYAPIAPAVYTHTASGNVILCRLSAKVAASAAMGAVRKFFEHYNPGWPFSYRWVNEEHEQKFNREILVGRLAGIFAALAIFIACLGIFGLAAYISEQRSREIGIRKVLGASVLGIWLKLSREFVVLVIAACILASPFAYIFLQNWLNKFDYRISVGPAVFLLAAGAVLLTTILTVSFHSIKAALANPIKSLRSID